MKKFGRRFLAPMLAGTLLFGMAVQAEASSYDGINLEDNKSCSLQVTLADTDTYHSTSAVYIDGATLSLYKAADMETDGTCTVSPQFAGVSELNSVLEKRSSGTEVKAEELEAAAEAASARIDEANIPGVDTKTTGSDGTATFSISDYGIYLVRETAQSGTAAHYTNMAPVLTDVPKLEEGGWTFDVVLNTKMTDNTGFNITVKKRAMKDNKITDTRVAGAKLQIVRAADPGAAAEEEWTTVEHPDHITDKLAPGKYILQEVEAPEGYDKAADIVFEITREGKVLIGGKEQTGAEITMGDPVTEKETEKPQKPNPSNPAPGNGGRPKTGDNSHILLYVILALAALCAAIGSVIWRRKKTV